VSLHFYKARNAIDCWQPPEAGTEAVMLSLSASSEGVNAANTLISDFCYVGKKPTVLKDSFCYNLLL
jgi:hypothetical protein